MATRSPTTLRADCGARLSPVQGPGADIRFSAPPAHSAHLVALVRALARAAARDAFAQAIAGREGAR